jgi:hypothetical protein
MEYIIIDDPPTKRPGKAPRYKPDKKIVTLINSIFGTRRNI